MNPQRSAWAVIVLLVSFAFAFLFVARCNAGTRLAERIVAVQKMPGVRSAKDDPVDADAFARAVSSATESREWAALIVAMASSETALAERLRLDDCKPWECDGGRAWGLWQLHRNEITKAYFGSHDVDVQARLASRMLRGAFYRCQKSGVPFPLSTFRAVSGRRCDEPLPGEEKRVALYNRILGRL